MSLPEDVCRAIRGVVGEKAVGLHEPIFRGKEREYLQDCLDSTFVSSVGKFVDRFETELAAYTGAKHAVAVVNGTAALHVALLLAGVGPDDEVLVPALSFVATAAAVKYCGATPHFIDCNEQRLGVDPLRLDDYLSSIAELRGDVCFNVSTGKPIRAVVPMHTFGHPVDIDGLVSVAARFKIPVVEDAAESLGSFVGDRHTGTVGLLGALSFNGNKIITTGGGGAILTNDTELARRAKHITTTAKVPHRWNFVHDQVGFNYRLPNLNAALGCAQLEQLPSLLAAKRGLAERYASAFAGVGGVRLVREPAGCTSNYWLQTLILDASVEQERDRILAATNDAGIMTRPSWTLMHRLPPYAACPRMPLPTAELLERRIINIPSSSQLNMAAGA